MALAVLRIAHTPPALAEIERTVRDGDACFLDVAVNETIRFRPSSPTFRLTKAPLERDGLTVPPETIVILYIALVHRRPDIYLDPACVPPRALHGRRLPHIPRSQRGCDRRMLSV